MEYIKTEWKDGDIITSEKLNHIENNMDGNVLYVLIKYINDAEIGSDLPTDVLSGTTSIDIENAFLEDKMVYFNGIYYDIGETFGKYTFRDLDSTFYIKEVDEEKLAFIDDYIIIDEKGNVSLEE